MIDKSKTYEESFAILERITESLNKDEISIDDLVTKTKEALEAARTCMEILKKQKGEFKKLEKEFSSLLEKSKNGDSSSDQDLSVSETGNSQ